MKTNLRIRNAHASLSCCILQIRNDSIFSSQPEPQITIPLQEYRGLVEENAKLKKDLVRSLHSYFDDIFS